MIDSTSSAERSDGLPPLQYWPARLAVAAFRVFSLLPWRVQILFGILLGRLLPIVARKRNAIARGNINRVYADLNDDERAILLTQHRKELGIGLLQVGFAWWSSDRRIIKRCDIEGLEHIHAAGDRPTVLLAMHSTCLEMLLRGLGTTVRFSAVQRPFGHPVFDRAMMQGRARSAQTLISKHQPKALLRAMRAREAVFIAADQYDTTDSAVTAEFLGQRTANNSTIARLVNDYAAVVIPVHATRQTDGRYAIAVRPALEFPSDDRASIARRINETFEQMIAEAPTQYYWVHDRFREPAA